VATIPARDIVQVNPGVLPAGGNALDIIGLMLTQNTRVPIGQVLQFASQANVATYFGASAVESSVATNYFNGFDNSHKKPGSMLVAQYPQGAVDAFMRGGSVAALTIPQLQAINGTLNITVDGYPRSVAALNLSAATSFSSAAGIIATALNAGGANPNVVSAPTSTIAAGTNTLTATIAGFLMYVTAIGSGTIQIGTIISGTGVSAGTMVTGQLSGTTGGVGTYTVSISQVVATSTSISGTYGTLTASSPTLGSFSVNQTLAGTGVTAGTQITALGTGTGGAGTYIVSPSQTVASTTITGAGSNVTVTFDSVSGGFVITSGVLIPTSLTSTIAVATGTTAASLGLTTATGAVTSQGSAGQTPAQFMASIVAITQNWATFFLITDPDLGLTSGINTQKQAFAAWVNSTSNQYCFICWDNDPTVLTTFPDAASLGQILAASNSSGTAIIWAPDQTQGPIKAAFVSGAAASIDFSQFNGRITFAFKSQTGLFADITNQTIAHNLGGDPQAIGSRGNFYNFYGAYATRNQQFVFLNRGFVSGPFLWLDSYIDQIWLNNALQLALMNLLVSVFSIPYNNAGYALIEAACLDSINAAVNFGAIRQNITLSQAQIAELNFQAGLDISQPIQTRGWYLQITDPGAQVRAARASPNCTLWYTDGQSVQAIILASIEIQ
jgi:hypothetical protein